MRTTDSAISPTTIERATDARKLYIAGSEVIYHHYRWKLRAVKRRSCNRLQSRY